MTVATGKDAVKDLIKQLEDEFARGDFVINEPGAVKHRTRIPLGTWEDVYVTNLQGDLAKMVADEIGTYTQASFTGMSRNLSRKSKLMLWLSPGPEATVGNMPQGSPRRSDRTRRCPGVLPFFLAADSSLLTSS